MFSYVRGTQHTGIIATREGKDPRSTKSSSLATLLEQENNKQQAVKIIQKK